MLMSMKTCVNTCLGTGLLAYIYCSGIYAFSAFPPATYKGDWFDMSSSDSSKSFIKIEHSTGSVPILMKVLVKPKGGNNADFVFEAFGSPQTEDDFADPRGGIAYIFSESEVLLWSCTRANQPYEGHSLLVGGYWGDGKFAQRATEVTVQIQAWSQDDFYPPDFVSQSYTMTPGNYKEIRHGLGQTPELVRVVGSVPHEGNVYYFYGTGSQEIQTHRSENNYGGIMFAFNDQDVRIWICDQFEIFTSNDGWGHGRLDIKVKKVNVKVYVWRTFGLLEPLYNSGWLDADQSKTTFFQLEYPECISDRFVDVRLQAIDGENEGFIFPGTGMAQTEGRSGSSYSAGGVLFAYSEDTVRLWIMKDSSSNVGIITVKGWGGQNKQQLSSVGKIRVRVWCDKIPWTPFGQASGKSECIWMNTVDQTSSGTYGELDTIANASFSDCALKCQKDKGCFGISQNGTECKFYGEVRFGSPTAVPNKESIYRLESSMCEKCRK